MHSHSGLIRVCRVLSVLLIGVLFSVVLVSCSSDSDPVTPTSFALIVTNKTSTNYNVYQQPSAAGDVFGKVGVAVSGVIYRINPLTPNVDYVFRLVRDGKTIDEFDFEKNVVSAGDDVAWEVK